ncbi:hypothetical protein G6011_11402 [Alternaria panax]|uniref:BTB domain-containing protein n=1 Tax=Alternaria panax TaxID=48097 RepID=A0AAD4NRK3_9PLEO|nr:hypothetical protein G6011_11402 [Alternaria panax]
MESSSFCISLSTVVSFLKTPVITVSVGPRGGDQQRFYVHENLLKRHSAFFTNALKPERFKEGFERFIPMPEDDPEVFAIYAQLLYRPDLLIITRGLDRAKFEHECVALAKLYTFADKVMDETTKLTLLDTIKCLTVNRLLPIEAAQIIYDGTLEDDPARAAFVQSFLRSGKQHSLNKIRDTGHPDLFRDLAFSLIFFDVRNESDALFAHHGINLPCIHDLQIMELATTTRGSREHLVGLAKTIGYNASRMSVTTAQAQSSKKIKETGLNLFAPERGDSCRVFEDRPLSKAIKNYRVQDVVYMPKLWNMYNGKMADSGFWQVMALKGVAQRVEESHQVGYQPNGSQKRLECWSVGVQRRLSRRGRVGRRNSGTVSMGRWRKEMFEKVKNRK